MADSQRIDDLRRRVQRDPTSIAFAQLAEECRRAGHFQEAVDVCRAGLEIHPGYLSARVTLGRALIELNDLDIALAELEHVLKSAPENLAAIRGIAEIHHRQGSLPDALAQYRSALALARNDPDLQRTVDELARKVEPIPPPASADGLSFDEMRDELLQNLLQPPPPAAVATVDPSPSGDAPVVPEPELPIVAEAVQSAPGSDVEPAVEVAAEAATAAEPIASTPTAAVEPVHLEEVSDDAAQPAQGVQALSVLEQWVEAIHVARAKPRT
jgi:tetratricopeptide (TPR) repeat protein